MRSLAHTIADHPWLAGLITIGSIALSLLITMIVIVRLPADYFANERAPRSPIGNPVLRLAVRVGKNLLGVVVIALGVVMSFPGVPGQGVLTILLGIMLCDLPGKRRMERWIIGRASVRKAVDKIRAKRGRPPLIID
ncbi:MAG: hypothetical protein K8W52_41105 [Deltaproteobacteria bacterium]|nr:hypothetical protein [Deltaproteobacteria bacterium]